MADVRDNPNRKIVRIPLVGSLNGREGNYSTSVDQSFQNVIFDVVKNAITGKDTIYCEKLPGFTTLNTPATTADTSYALYVATGGDTPVVVTGFDNDVYSGTSNIGTVTGTVETISECKFSTTGYLLATSKNGSATYGYYYQFTPSTGSFTNISDGDFPGNNSLPIAGQFVELDGYIFIMTKSGRIYNSDLNSVSSWTSTGFLSTQAYPDSGVGLIKYKKYIVAFSNASIEFFEDVGNATGSPLQNVPQATLHYGTAHHKYICQMGDPIYFIGQAQTGDMGVYKLENFQIEKISDRVVSLVVQKNYGLTTEPQMGLYPMIIRGRNYLVLTGSATSSTFLYDVTNKVWIPAPLFYRLKGVGQINTTSLFGSLENVMIFYGGGDVINGRVYYTNNTGGGDWVNPNNYTSTIITSKLDFGTRLRKRIHRLSLIGDKQGSSTVIAVNWTDDDYGTYSTARNVNMTSLDPSLSNCGSFLRRAFKLASTAGDGVFRLEAIEIEYSELDH